MTSLLPIILLLCVSMTTAFKFPNFLSQLGGDRGGFGSFGHHGGEDSREADGCRWKSCSREDVCEMNRRGVAECVRRGGGHSNWESRETDEVKCDKLRCSRRQECEIRRGRAECVDIKNGNDRNSRETDDAKCDRIRCGRNQRCHVRVNGRAECIDNDEGKQERLCRQVRCDRNQVCRVNARGNAECRNDGNNGNNGNNNNNSNQNSAACRRARCSASERCEVDGRGQTRCVRRNGGGNTNEDKCRSKFCRTNEKCEMNRAGNAVCVQRGGFGGNGNDNARCRRMNCRSNEECEVNNRGVAECRVRRGSGSWGGNNNGGTTCRDLNCRSNERCEVTGRSARCVRNGGFGGWESNESDNRSECSPRCGRHETCDVDRRGRGTCVSSTTSSSGSLCDSKQPTERASAGCRWLSNEDRRGCYNWKQSCASKSGTCPSVGRRPPGIKACRNECTNDNRCYGDAKCCKQECGGKKCIDVRDGFGHGGFFKDTRE